MSKCRHVWELSHNETNQIGYRCVRCLTFQTVSDVRSFQQELTPEIDEMELLRFISAIEDGRISLYPLRLPAEIHTGPVAYRASNGWTAVVYNDGDTWDYFERIESDDDRLVTFTTMPAAVQRYRPERTVAITRYEFAITPRRDSDTRDEHSGPGRTEPSPANR